MSKQDIRKVFDKGEGILRMVPNFVPRSINQAGQRLRLHLDDYFALGTQRSSIKERWFSSTVPARNGELAPPDEGMSYVATTDHPEDKVLFKDFVDELGERLIGSELFRKYGTWPMYSKFFDYRLPLFHHLHLDDLAAGRVGQLGKPEAYYFPPQLNSYMGEFPVTYFGFDPDVTKEQVIGRLLGYETQDTRITELSRAYRIELGTGWYTPAGVVHAPGSVLTYEPQWNSDVGAVFENINGSEVFSYNSLVGNIPEPHKRDMEYILTMLDWEKNVDPHYKAHYFRPPIPCPTVDERYSEKWITYANDYFGAKELTIQPNCKVMVKDPVAYGCIMIQGHGHFGPYLAEAASMLHFGQLSGDEYFVSEDAALQGVWITNHSIWEPMVILKHFAANHCQMPREVPSL